MLVKHFFRERIGAVEKIKLDTMTTSSFF